MFDKIANGIYHTILIYPTMLFVAWNCDVDTPGVILTKCHSESCNCHKSCRLNTASSTAHWWN